MRWIARSMLVSSLVTVGACSTERAAPPVPVAAPVETVVATPATATPAPQRATLASAEKTDTPELIEGRDPFEATALLPPTPPPRGDDRLRKSKRFNLDQLKLVGIVSTADAPRAMLVDPRGKGWVVMRGELVGRAEVVHDAQGDHPVSWRVDRIRESEVVLVREDATHALVPSSTTSTRVLALRHDPVVADDAELDD